MRKSSNSEILGDAQVDRRAFLQLTVAAAAVSMVPGNLFAAPRVPVPQMARFPDKRDLILLTDRPPQLETPIKYFVHDLTPNGAFFVRWHLAGIPTSIDTRTFRLSVAGHVDRPLRLSLDELRKQYEPVSLIAVAQCSGNSRSFFEPGVPGGQWANGAMGNAKWTGVRLRDLLAGAGVKDGAVDVSFGGLDRSPLPGVAPFVKSLDLSHATDGEVMIAYAMNDAELPMLNGFPLRLVVPGWFATYWVKALNEINVLSEKFHGYWMDKAYRIPKTPLAVESPQALATETTPIHRHTVRSIFVLPEPGARIPAGTDIELQGVALDSGEQIRRVEVSTDSGKIWVDAKLDQELGKYSWRRWRLHWKPGNPGNYQLMVRATNGLGEGQVTTQWNRGGYQRNVVEKLDVTVD